MLWLVERGQLIHPSGEAVDQGIGIAVVLVLPVRQGALALAVPALTLIKEDGEGSHQGQIARGGGMTHLAMIFTLGVVPPVMLLGFDTPVATHPRQQNLWARFR